MCIPRSFSSTSDDHERSEVVPLTPDLTEDVGDEDVENEAQYPDVLPGNREHRLRETVGDEFEQRHHDARESADPNDHRDEVPNNA